MLAYSDVSLVYNGVKVDPANYIEHQEEKDFLYEEEEKPAESARALFIRWKQALYSKEYICENSGVVYDEKDYTPLQKGTLSLYLLSEHFEQMHRETL